MAIAANNPLLNPNAPLSGPALLQAAKALANAQTQPAINQIASEIAQNNRQTTGAENLTGGYFTQLGQQANQGLTDEQGIQSGLNTQLGTLSDQEASQLQGIGNNALTNFQKYSPGQTGGVGATSLASEIARQQGLAAQQQGLAKTFGANQGANYSGLAASNLGTFGLKGQEDLNQIAQAGQIKNQPLTEKLGEENQTYGADLATALGKLRQQEITNQQADAGLNIKDQAATTTAANDAATQANNSAKTKISQQNANTSAKNSAFNTNPAAVGSPAWQRVQSSTGTQWAQNPNAVGSAAWARVQAANARTGGGGSKPLPQVSNNAWFDKLGKVQAAIQTWQQTGVKNAQGKVTEPHPTDAQMRQILQNNGYDPNAINAAFELLGWGHITPETHAELYAEGIRGGTFRGAPIKVAPAPAPQGLALSGGLAGSVPGIGNTIANSVPTIS